MLFINLNIKGFYLYSHLYFIVKFDLKINV